MDMTQLVTLILLLMTVAHDGTDNMAVHHQDRGSGLYGGLVEEGGGGCDHVRMVIEMGACVVLALPSRSCEGSDVEIDLGVHYHNSHACNQ